MTGEAEELFDTIYSIGRRRWHLCSTNFPREANSEVDGLSKLRVSREAMFVGDSIQWKVSQLILVFSFY